DGTRRRYRIAATLEVQLGKGRFVRVAKVLIGYELDRVVGPEIDNHKRTRANRIKVFLSAFRCPRAEAIGELCRLNDGRRCADKGQVRVWLRLVEMNGHGAVIDYLDTLDPVEPRELRTAAFGIHAVFCRELEVISREVRTVGPLHAFFQRPGN